MKNTPANEKLYWNNRARNYPLPFDPAILGKTRRILRLLRRLGTEFSGRDILDIGCGTGVYALPLARKAGRVLGVDSSAPMLKVFRAQARAAGIKNARCLAAAWAEVPPEKVRGRFDIALASMTAAVRTKKDLLKMEAAARERCVYIGWAGVRENALLEAVYAHHGLEYKAPEGAERALKALKALGRTPRVKFIRDSWTKSAAPAETLRDLEVSMRVNGARLDREWVRTLLEGKARGGQVRQRTRVRKALITWEPPFKPKRRPAL
ncbi:MAG: class I SAM-dependent methyltransferase [Elusimicrobia bacterium]|nr:class I SAM-dependent methyltransferase [Elusimicrobiota bacterium]